jgi:hypothetical protein
MSSVCIVASRIWACTAWDESGLSYLTPDFLRRSGHGRWLGLRLCVS